MKTWLPVILLLGAGAASSQTAADDLKGASVYLCSAQTVSVCTPDDGCVTGPASTWDVPEFIQVDLNAKRLSTTKASGTNRSTPIESLQRKDGSVFLQGLENGRAFSIRIEEQSGEMSAAVSRDGLVVAVFGSCTPTGGS